MTLTLMTRLEGKFKQMKKTIKTGTFENAIACLLREGGQVFPGRDGSDGVTWLCGSKQVIFWKADSKKYPLMVEQAKALDFPEPELATGSSLVKHTLDMCGIEYKGTYFHPCWRDQAKSGWHWHYMYHEPGRHGLCMEIDLSSAYLTSFLSAPSCFLHGSSTWVHDRGAIANLKAISPLFSKWFRLQLIGALASWKMKFITRDDDPNNKFGYKERYRMNISYGYLFNSAHKAILKVYGDMRNAHRIVGDDCVRCHTDSLLVKLENGMGWENELCNYLQGQGYELKIKKIGDTWIHGVNCGFVGFYPIGAKSLAFDSAKAEGVRLEKPDNKLFKSILNDERQKRYTLAM